MPKTTARSFKDLTPKMRLALESIPFGTEVHVSGGIAVGTEVVGGRCHQNGVRNHTLEALVGRGHLAMKSSTSPGPGLWKKVYTRTGPREESAAFALGVDVDLISTTTDNTGSRAVGVELSFQYGNCRHIETLTKPDAEALYKALEAVLTS